MIVQHLAKRGLTISQAAKKAPVTFSALFSLIHREPPPSVSEHTIEKLCYGELAIPIELVSPSLAKALKAS